MNPMLAGSLAGAGFGILKSGQQQDQWRDQAYLSALSNVYAPLFGKAPDASLPSRPDSMQTVLDFGLKGAAAGSMFGDMFGSGAGAATQGTVTGAEQAAKGQVKPQAANNFVPPESGTYYGAISNQTMVDQPNMSLAPDRKSELDAYFSQFSGQQPHMPNRFNNPLFRAVQPKTYDPSKVGLGMIYSNDGGFY